MRACVVRTGVANTASVVAALARCGVDATLTLDPAEIAGEELVVLPGVGSFGAGMCALREAGVDRAIVDRVHEGRATLAICLGMQLLASGSEESPGVAGLGVVGACVSRFREGVRTPQFGWNLVEPCSDPRTPAMLGAGHAYFANSYRLTEAPEGWGVAYTDHGGRFVSAMWRGRVLACQFHPELSGPWGAGLLRRWALGAEVSPC